MSEKAVGSQCLGDQSPFKYRVRKTYSVFEHLLYKLRTFGSKYVNRTVIHSIYCTNYVLPVIGLILKFKKAADISKMIKDYEATPFTFR